MLNHIIIMGRLTRNVELRFTQSNKPVASFTLAVDRDRQSEGARLTDFIDCVAWGKTGEFVNNYFQKGSMAVVSGRLQARDWQDRDGNKRRSWEVNVENIYFGEAKSTGAGKEVAQNGYVAPPGAFSEIGDEDGELPF